MTQQPATYPSSATLADFRATWAITSPRAGYGALVGAAVRRGMTARQGLDWASGIKPYATLTASEQAGDRHWRLGNYTQALAGAGALRRAMAQRAAWDEQLLAAATYRWLDVLGLEPATVELVQRVDRLYATAATRNRMADTFEAACLLPEPDQSQQVAAMRALQPDDDGLIDVTGYFPDDVEPVQPRERGDGAAEAAWALRQSWVQVSEAYSAARALLDQVDHPGVARIGAYVDQVFDPSSRMLGMQSVGAWIREVASMLEGTQPCDECGHAGDVHLSLHEIEDADFTRATCWAQDVCRECSPATWQRLQHLL